jgi:hypothetical protein
VLLFALGILPLRLVITISVPDSISDIDVIVFGTACPFRVFGYIAIWALLVQFSTLESYTPARKEKNHSATY